MPKTKSWEYCITDLNISKNRSFVSGKLKGLTECQL